MDKELQNIRYMYHATAVSNLASIAVNGIQKRLEGVFLCTTPEDCCKFLLIRHVPNILVSEVDLDKLDRSKLEESFDHSQTFFQCRAWIYTEDVPRSAITEVIQYTFDKKGE